ncbi:MAG: amidohydrolase [Tannerella sp.]|jgi:amidohydrolase|nr:amidohydrolase [Tannerella sp.]
MKVDMKMAGYVRKVIFLLLVPGAVAFSVSARQPVGKEEILAKVKEAESYVKAMRGYLHEHPEVSSEEYETTRFLRSEVEKMGLPVTPVEGTGFYAILDTHRPGKTVGLRTDIDALPIHENPENLKQRKKWISQVDGVSHACGHDGHMAILLGTMKILCDLKDRLAGRIVFIFEEGEETGAGIDRMVSALEPLRIDAFYGNHLRSSIRTGEFFVREGALMAGAGTVSFDVDGRGGHASRPDLSVNPIFAAADILGAISVAWNNQRDVTKTLTLGISQIHGGAANNVIPNTVYIGGTIRFFDRGEADRGFDILRRVAAHVAAAHNCTVRIRDDMGILLLPVINDSGLTALAREAIAELYPGRMLTSDEHVWYAAESFSKYSSLAPAVFLFVGIGNDELGSGAEHHNDRFDLDEEALPCAVGGMVQFAVRFLSGVE